MCWIYSQALAAEYLDTCFADTALCVLSKSNRTVGLFLYGGKMMDTCRLSRFGMTYEHLTDDDGEALLTWYQEDSLAKMSVPPVTEPVSPVKNHRSGLSCCASFGKYDRSTSLWKTPANLFGEGSMLSSAAWTKAGTMRNGVCWERTTWAHRISESDAGFSEGATAPQIPTPLATDWKRRGPNSKQQGLPEYVRKFPTPVATGGICGGTGSMRKLKQLTIANIITEEERRSMVHGNGGKLNPEFVEWLMAVPIGWSGLKVLATPKYRSAPPSHGKPCTNESMKNEKSGKRKGELP
jgi:hypothetical protein